MKKLVTIALVIFVVSVAANSFSATFSESGDAGQTLTTAQTLTSGTDVITGTLSNDADLFNFGWGGGDFYVNTVGTCTFDSQLFLFDYQGHGVQANDDGIASAGPAYLQVSSLGAGDYFLGISFFDYDPRNAAESLMFQSSPYQNLYGPSSATDILTSWSGSYTGSGAYTINFSTTSSTGDLGDTNPTTGPGAPVPEPSTILLLGSGLLGLGWYGRKRKKA